MCLEDLLSRINDYTKEEQNMILRAYAFASNAHKNQTRKSGEPYIIHPTAVACILADMGADCDTICAGLLHDTVEDVDGITSEIIAENFNETIADLVEGVTKIKKKSPNDNTQEANMHKIIDSITKDVRIFIIKLADRLHNMRTMEYQSPEKQIAKSLETLMIYTPIATLLGEYTIKTELEDLAFKYLYKNEYKDLLKLSNDYQNHIRETVDKVLMEISVCLNDCGYSNNIKVKRKNLYGLHLKLKKYKELSRIHDYLAVKILLPEDEDCYFFRDKITRMYNTVTGRDKDYIAFEKDNRYRGLHSTIYASGVNTMIQLQFKTPEMFKINSHGITAYWDFCNDHHINKPGDMMQDEVRKMPFYKTLVELANAGLSIEDYNAIVKSDILTNMIYVMDNYGHKLELPSNSTPVDFAYHVDPVNAPFLDYALVNGRYMTINNPLESRDVVELIYKDEMNNLDYLEDNCRCLQTKRKIRGF